MSTNNEIAIKELTAQNKIFLMALSSGKSTLDSYREAGYKGSDHAAYELRSQLKAHLLAALEAQGIDKTGLLLNIKQLLELPVKEESITIKNKLDLLKLLAKTTALAETKTPNITPFVINNNVSIEPNKGDVKSVDTVIEE